MSEQNGLPIRRYQANVKNVKRDDKGQYVWWKEYDFIQQQLTTANERMRKLEKMGKKYSTATQWFDELIEGRFVDMSPMIKKFVNQIGKEILQVLKEKQ